MRVVHCRREPCTVNCGRPNVLGNPYVIGRDGDRPTVISKYEVYARNTPTILEEIGKLKEDDVLGCYCAPDPCHCDIIIKIWKELRGRTTSDQADLP